MKFATVSIMLLLSSGAFAQPPPQATTDKQKCESDKTTCSAAGARNAGLQPVDDRAAAAKQTTQEGGQAVAGPSSFKQQ
jgi:hypothetical protein